MRVSALGPVPNLASANFKDILLCCRLSECSGLYHQMLLEFLHKRQQTYYLRARIWVLWDSVRQAYLTAAYVLLKADCSISSLQQIMVRTFCFLWNVETVQPIDSFRFIQICQRWHHSGVMLLFRLKECLRFRGSGAVVFSSSGAKPQIFLMVRRSS